MKKLIVVLAALMLILPAAFADVVPFSGTTSGTFSAGTPKDLTFTGNSFSGSTHDDLLCWLMGTCGVAYNLDLGQFSLDTPGFLKAPDQYDGKKFDLTVTFTDPDKPNGALDFTASLEGTVHWYGGLTDSVTIDFTSPMQLLKFGPGEDGSGWFDLTVHDVTFTAVGDSLFGGVSGDITNATITAGPTDPAAAVPEPASVLLFGSVLTGMVAVLRKKKV